MKQVLIAQSGGPTAAINATLAGAVKAAMTGGEVSRILGGRNGVEGVFREDFVDLGRMLYSEERFRLLNQTPAAALGSCRMKLREEEQFSQLLSILRKHEIDCFVYIGGNDSMDTVDQFSAYLLARGIRDITVVGAPKTIDNDLAGTDHTPGFGSAAKYVAATIAELERDCSVYSLPSVTIAEIMGRDAGWLTASSALARCAGGAGPSLIYLCERSFDMQRFLADVREALKRRNGVLVAVSEGIRDADGAYISAHSREKDAFGHSIVAGAGAALERAVRAGIGCKVRTVELSLMQRCAGHITSAVDLDEASMLGMHAMHAALAGKSGMMSALVRTGDDPYRVAYTLVPAAEVANRVRRVPDDFISESGNDVTKRMLTYLKPLIAGENPVVYENGIPKHLYFNG